MYCPQCDHLIENGESACAHCGCELETKRSRIKTKTIVIICLSVVLLTAIIFLALRILDFAENPTRPQPAPEAPSEYPVAPTGPPEFPVGPENAQSDQTAARVNAAGGLRMREGPGTDYDIIITIPNYEHITILEEEDGWALVEHSGASGWVSTEFLLREGDARFWDEPQEDVVTPGNRSPDPTSVRINAESGLRMRMGPDASYHVVMIIPYDEVVLAHDESDGWVYIEHLGYWGWVSAAFLADE